MHVELVKKHTMLLSAGAAFLIGSALSSVYAREAWIPYALGACFCALFGAIVAMKARLVMYGCVVILCSALGVLRSAAELTVSPDAIVYFARQSVYVEGVIREEPDRRISETHYVVSVDRSVTSSRRVTGRVLIKMPRYPEYDYGDMVRLRCTVKLPETSTSGFRYDKYLAVRGIDALCERPALERVSSRHGSWLFHQMLRIKYGIAKSIDAVWSEPNSSFMAGILYGSRAGLPTEIGLLFNKTGITHVIAVSGSNISIIAVAVMSVLFAVGLHRRQASWIAVAGIALFVVFTGASASVVRAGIMGAIAIFGKVVGRPVRSSIVLTVTATIMAVINPYVLVWDAGFQLSFLSTMGLIYIAPLIHRFVPFDGWPKPVAVTLQNGITTLSAIIATLPLILYQFGRLSVVAPVVNVLMLWTIPYIMLFGFIATVVGMVFVPLGVVVSMPSVLLMDYVLWLVRLFGGASFAAFDITLPWWGMVGMYCLLVYGVLRRSQLPTSV